LELDVLPLEPLEVPEPVLQVHVLLLEQVLIVLLHLQHLLLHILDLLLLVAGKVVVVLLGQLLLLPTELLRSTLQPLHHLLQPISLHLSFMQHFVVFLFVAFLIFLGSLAFLLEQLIFIFLLLDLYLQLLYLGNGLLQRLLIIAPFMVDVSLEVLDVVSELFVFFHGHLGLLALEHAVVLHQQQLVLHLLVLLPLHSQLLLHPLYILIVQIQLRLGSHRFDAVGFAAHLGGVLVAELLLLVVKVVGSHLIGLQVLR